MHNLTSLASHVVDPSIEIGDLTAPPHAGTSIMQRPPELNQSWSSRPERISAYGRRGPEGSGSNIWAGEHSWAQADSPVHRINGRDHDVVSHLPRTMPIEAD